MADSKFVKSPSSVIPDWVLRMHDPLIRVDRTSRPEYPDPMDKIKKRVHPELELKGPSEFNVTEFERWFREEQTEGICIGGYDMHDSLEAEGLLERCINLADILAIQAKGINFFRNYFPEGVLFAWSSVVQSHGGGLYVPYLIKQDNEVVAGRQLLIVGILSRIPVLCHMKK